MIKVARETFGLSLLEGIRYVDALILLGIPLYAGELVAYQAGIVPPPLYCGLRIRKVRDGLR